VNETTPSPTLSDKAVYKLQQLTGTLLYYARAVDPTLIMPINVLASEQSNAVNTSGKAGAQIPQLPLGDDSSPWGR
jgi:hypothetical protein